MEKHDKNSNDFGRQRRYRPGAVKGIDSRRLDMVESSARARQLPHHKLKDNPRMNLMLALLHRRDLLDSLRSGLQSFLDPTATILKAKVKRCRYALRTTFHPERCLPATDVPPLTFAGDAFGWPCVEGAALSGIAAADVIKEILPLPFPD